MVLDGKDENPLVHDPVNHVIRKPRHPSLSVPAAQRGTHLRKLSNLVANFLHDANETKPKALTPLLIYACRLDHLRGGSAVEIYGLHRSASRAR